MQTWRYRRIVFFFARVLISLIVWEIILPNLGLRSWSARTRSSRLTNTAVQFRSMAIQMGGVLIKVGQFLSSRVDVLPNEITVELAGLQDEVPPESFESIRQVVEAEFGMALEEKFLAFNETPLAAASLGQVHLAKLRVVPLTIHEGKDDNLFPKTPDEYALDYVVKVQRLNIEKIIATDLAALRTVGRWIQHYPPIKNRMNVSALLAEFTRTLYEEIDYLAEGRNAETFSANFKSQTGVLVPRVIWSHTTRRVLTLENVQGIKVTDYDAIRAAGIDCAEVASRLLDTYLQQIFLDGFFHADPHPGNLFVRVLTSDTASNEENLEWQLTFVDFGMVGRIPPQTIAAVRELVIGIGTRNTARVVKAYQMLGILLPGADLGLIEQASEEVFKRFWGKNMTEMTAMSVDELQGYLDEFRELIYDLPFQVPQDIIFLVRAVSILSGMCTGLDPNFNVWTHLAPFSRELIAEEMMDKQKNWGEELGLLVRKILSFPGRISSIMEKIESGKLTVQNPELTKEIRRLKTAIGQLTGTLVILALLLISVQLYLGGEVGLAILAVALMIASWIWIILRGLR